MQLNIKRTVAFGVSALAVAAFAGGAYAATQDPDANAPQAFLSDVAKRLHVTPQQLTAALQGAALDRLNAAVAAGKLTQAQANAIKQHIQQNGGAPFGPLMFGPPGAPSAPGAPGGPGPPVPPGAPGFFHGPRFFGGVPSPGADPLGAVAKYLGLSDAQLFKELASGKSLAQIAQARGKSTSGVKAALLAAIKSRLDNRYRYGAPPLPAPRAFRYGSGPVTPAQGPVGPIA